MNAQAIINYCSDLTANRALSLGAKVTYKKPRIIALCSMHVLNFWFLSQDRDMATAAITRARGERSRTSTPGRRKAARLAGSGRVKRVQRHRRVDRSSRSPLTEAILPWASGEPSFHNGRLATRGSGAVLVPFDLIYLPRRLLRQVPGLVV